MSKFQFSNVVVVDEEFIGVVVKSWSDDTYDVYVRSHNCVQLYRGEDIRHLVYDKTIDTGEE